MLQIKVGADIQEAINALKKFGTEIDRAGGVTEATANKMASALNKALNSAQTLSKGADFSNVKVGLQDIVKQTESVFPTFQQLNSLFHGIFARDFGHGEGMKELSKINDQVKSGNLSLGQFIQTLNLTEADIDKIGAKLQSFGLIKVAPQVQIQTTGNLDFTKQFEEARQRINASIDANVNEALGIKVQAQIDPLPAINSIKILEAAMDELKVKISESTDPREIQKLAVQFGALEREANSLKETFSKVSQLKIVAPFGNIIPANLQQSVAAFGGGVKRVSSDLTLLGRSSIATTESIGNVSNKLGQLPRSSGAATQSLINLGRIAQDLPFGFLGIANNLNPLLESFQRTQKEAGGTGAALRLIGKDLLGAGGLGFALSAVTALLSFASIGFSAWTRGMGGAKKATEEAADANAKYKESVHNAFSEVAQEASKVEVLVAALKQGNLSYAERKGAIEELKRISPSYFAQLDAEKLNIDSLNISYKNYLKSLQNAAEAKVLEKQLEGIIEKRLELEKVLNPPQFTFDAQGNRIQNFILETAQTQKIRNANQAEYNNLLKGEEVLSNRLAQIKPKDIIVPDIKKEKDKQTKTEFLFDFLPFDPSGNLKPEQRNQLLDAADKFSKEFQGIFKGLDFATKAKSEDEKIKLALKFDADLKAGNVQFDLTKIKEATEKALKPEDVIPEDKLQVLSTQVADQFIRSFQNASEQIKNQNPFNLTPNFRIDTDLKSQIELFKTNLQRIGAEIPDTIRAADIFGNPVDVTFDQLFDTSKIANSDALKALQDAFNKIKNKVVSLKDQLQSAINDSLKSIQVDGLSSIGEAIGAALSGSDIGSVFQNFEQTLGGAVQALGKQIIGLFITADLLKKALKSVFTNPVVGIAAGIALVAVGAAIKNLAGKGIKGFAKGGWVGGSGNGDTVPAMLTPGEFVVTKDKAPFIAALLKLLGGGINSIKNFKLPLHFAQGGFVPTVRNTDVQSPISNLQKALSGLAFSQPTTIIPDVKIRGNDLVLVFNRTNQSQFRNFGR